MVYLSIYLGCYVVQRKYEAVQKERRSVSMTPQVAFFYRCAPTLGGDTTENRTFWTAPQPLQLRKFYTFKNSAHELVDCA